MTPKVRKALLWGGAFLLAFASGNVLGRFTISGLVDGDKLPDSSEAQNFWAAQDRAHGNDTESDETAPVYIYQAREAHVCEGCDAGETRGRLRLDNLEESYSELSGDAGHPPAPAQDWQSAPAASAAGY